MSTETLMMLTTGFIMLIGAISTYLARSHEQRRHELKDIRIEADYWRSQLHFADTRKPRVNLVKARPVELPKPAEPDPASFIPADDPMVLCPACGLMGMHSLDKIPTVTNPIRTITQPDGEVLEIGVWGGGIPGYYRRQCVFCQHRWEVPLPKESP